MSGEGASLVPNAGAASRVPVPVAGADPITPVRSGSLLRRIVRKLLPHPAAAPAVLGLDELREIDRRLALALIDAQRRGPG